LHKNGEYGGETTQNFPEPPLSHPMNPHPKTASTVPQPAPKNGEHGALACTLDSSTKYPPPTDLKPVREMGSKMTGVTCTKQGRSPNASMQQIDLKHNQRSFKKQLNRKTEQPNRKIRSTRIKKMQHPSMTQVAAAKSMVAPSPSPH